MGEAGEWRGGNLFRTTWLAGINPHSRPQTVRLAITFVGQDTRVIALPVASGGRWEYNLADAAPMPLVSVHNATVKIDCDPAWCPTWATIYADTLRRASVASHPEIQWGCPQ